MIFLFTKRFVSGKTYVRAVASTDAKSARIAADVDGTWRLCDKSPKFACFATSHNTEKIPEFLYFRAKTCGTELKMPGNGAPGLFRGKGKTRWKRCGDTVLDMERCILMSKDEERVEYLK